MSVAIVVQKISDNQSVPPESSFTQWVGRVFADVRAGEVGIRIVDEEEIHGLNRQYRGKDAATNVLSFAYENDANDESEDLPIGDIVICAPIIEREAQEQGKPISAHWAHIAIHGALHLCGYDHETDAEAEAMEALESSLLAEFGFANPYRSLAQRHTGLQDRPYSNG